MLTRLHLHTMRSEHTVGAFRWRTCRCGAVQAVWLAAGRTRWASDWGTDDEVREQLRRQASDGKC